jgi:hypothetical protein
MILTDRQRKILAEHIEKHRREIVEKDETATRMDVSRRARELFAEARLLEGGALTREQLARLIALEWEIQNLQALVLPQLLGTYHYYRYFKGFEVGAITRMPGDSIAGSATGG